MISPDRRAFEVVQLGFFRCQELLKVQIPILLNLLDEIHELRDSLRELVDSIRYPSDDEKEEK